MRADLRWELCLSIFLLPFLFGCGTPGVPQPPSLGLAKPVSDLKGTRSENRVTLTWTVPQETTDGATFRRRGRTRICRALDQQQLNQCSAIATLETPASKAASFTDNLPADSTGVDDYATYAIEIDNDRGRSAGLSNQVQ